MMGIISQILDLIFGDNPAEIIDIIVFLAFIVLIFSALLYFIDFITLGFFKRKRWIARWYYPIYRFFSLITFSWLYRPLYYNLIDNRFGRKVGLFLVPYFIIITSLASMRATMNLYIPEEREGLEILNSYFEDTRDVNARIHNISIPSKFITNGYLELFIKYNARNDDDVVQKICPSIIPDETSGFGSNINLSFTNSSEEDKYYSPPDSMLYCVSELYKVYINDSLYQNLDYYFYRNLNFGEEGLKTIIDLGRFPRGKYTLKIDHGMYQASKDSLYYEHFVTTPFWIE